METGFSIIIPIYRVEQYLDECVQSVLAQNYENYEVILVDDGSPDGCPEICEHYAEQYPGIRVIHKENEGLSEARNTGLRSAKKDYILFLDSDDFYGSRDLLSELDKAIHRNAADVVMFQRTVCHENGRPTGPEKPYGRRLTALSQPGRLMYELSLKDQLDASASMKAIRRTFLTDNALFFKKGIFCEDVEWFFRMAPLIKSAGIMDFPAYFYRIRSDSISHTISRKNVNDLMCSIEDYSEKCRTCRDDSLRKALLNYLGYQYYIVLGLTGGYLSGQEREEMLKRLEKCRWLEEYAVSRKTILPSMLVKLSGMRAASCILGKYIKRRN